MAPNDADRLANEVVVPAVAEFSANRLSQRHSYVACALVYHLHDHIAWATSGGELKPIRDALEKCAGESWRIVEGVATGVKHAVVTDRNKFKHTPGNERARPPALWDQGLWDQIRWDDAVGGLEVDYNGTHCDLYDCVTRVLRAYTTCFPGQLSAVDLTYEADSHPG